MTVTLPTLTPFSVSASPPFIQRVTNPDRFWGMVDKYELETECSRVETVRNMDEYLRDPNGWIVAKQREKNKGEKISYMGKSKIQRRPVFSAFWAAFLAFFFLSFLPGWLQDVGEFHSSALNGGFCAPDVRIIEGRFECTKGVFDENVGPLFPKTQR